MIIDPKSELKRLRAELRKIKVELRKFKKRQINPAEAWRQDICHAFREGLRITDIERKKISHFDIRTENTKTIFVTSETPSISSLARQYGIHRETLHRFKRAGIDINDPVAVRTKQLCSRRVKMETVIAAEEELKSLNRNL